MTNIVHKDLKFYRCLLRIGCNGRDFELTLKYVTAISHEKVARKVRLQNKGSLLLETTELV